MKDFDRLLFAAVQLMLALAFLLPPDLAHAGGNLEPDDHIIVAVANPLRNSSGAPGSLGAYGSSPRYVIGSAAAGVLSRLERDYFLGSRVDAWPIPALGVYCVVYPVPRERRAHVLEELAQDARVRLAQPLQEFRAFERDTRSVAYNDPYVSLQRGFIDVDAAAAHRVSTGKDIDVAVVDTGVDDSHPDLKGRIAAVHDETDGGAVRSERHGTEVAGVIVAAANNAQGIAGIAPGAKVTVFRACWYEPGARGARCNSFTLAKALAAVLESNSRVVNLSLGGPADPLLRELLLQIVRQGRIVVAALPPDGRVEGFPASVPGVIVAGAAPGPLPAGVLPAPGNDVLTLTPGAHYDFASGSSMAAAHVSGIAALMLAVRPQLDAGALRTLMAGTVEGEGAVVNAARAVDLASRSVLTARTSLRP